MTSTPSANGRAPRPTPRPSMQRIGRMARLVPAAEVVEHVHRRAGGDLAAVGLGERAEDAGHHAEAGVGAHAERRGEARLEQAALAGDPVVEVVEQALVHVEIGLEHLEIPAEGDAQQAGVGHEVDRAARLVVRARAVEGDHVAGAAQREVDAVRPRVGAAVVVEEIVEAPRPSGIMPRNSSRARAAVAAMHASKAASTVSVP